MLEARAVTVRRGRRDVLDGVTLALRAGETVHLAGANGSGKTSLLRVLAGLAAPARGTLVRQGGCAFVPERVLLAPGLRGGEWLAAMRRLRGLAPVGWEDAVATSGIASAVLARPAATLSKGTLQRLALVEALRAEAGLLLLDEPFAGLDAVGREWLGEELRGASERGAAVLLTDHSGSAAGQVGLAGTLRLQDGTAEARPAGPPGPPGPPRTDARSATTLEGAGAVRVRAVHPDGRRLDRSVAGVASDDLLRTLLAEGWHIEELGP